jgi:hypothetical protein
MLNLKKGQLNCIYQQNRKNVTSICEVKFRIIKIFFSQNQILIIFDKYKPTK